MAKDQRPPDLRNFDQPKKQRFLPRLEMMPQLRSFPCHLDRGDGAANRLNSVTTCS
jgi:hypothetical protein